VKSFLVVAAVFIFANSLASGQSVKRNDKLEQEIRKLDLAHADAILRRDAEALNQLLAEDVTTNHPTNKVVKEREGIFALIRRGVINYSSFVREPEAFLFHQNMVVVMGHETLVPAGDAPEAGKTIRRRYTNVWMKRKGKWQLAVRHAHIICSN
jgi:ketosteroid isomerase-like protein